MGDGRRAGLGRGARGAERGGAGAGGLEPLPARSRASSPEIAGGAGAEGCNRRARRPRPPPAADAGTLSQAEGAGRGAVMADPRPQARTPFPEGQTEAREGLQGQWRPEAHKCRSLGCPLPHHALGAPRKLCAVRLGG